MEKKGKKKFLIGTAILLIISLIANGFFIFKYVADGKMHKAGSVCGDEIINKYNKSLIGDNYEAERVDLTKEIQGKAGYRNDVNCLLLLQSTDRLDIERYEELKRKMDLGINPSLKIRRTGDFEDSNPLRFQEEIILN